MKKLLHSRVLKLSLLWLLAIASGGVAMMAARAYVDEQVDAERKKFLSRADRTVPVVVAKFDLQRGDLIDASSMAIRELPADHLPASAISPDRFETVAGSKLGRNMRSGEPLLIDSLQARDDTSSLAARLRPGTRAVTIAVDEINALSGMLQPGDRIDLLMSARAAEGGNRGPIAREVTLPLMQDILVLATGKQVGQVADQESRGRLFTSITMELTPDQAQKLVTAQRGGRLTAMLRSPGDRLAVKSKPVDLDQLLGVAPEFAPPPRIDRLRTELIIGGSGGKVQSTAVGALDSPPETPASDRAGLRKPTLDLQGSSPETKPTSDRAQQVFAPILIR